MKSGLIYMKLQSLEQTRREQQQSLRDSPHVTRSNIDQRCLFIGFPREAREAVIDTLGKYLFHDFACKAIKDRKEPRHINHFPT